MKKGMTILFLAFSCTCAVAQTRVQSQVWTGLLSQVKLNDKWTVLGDLIIRRNDLLNYPSFSFVRAGLARQLNKHSFLALGYGHMWVEPTVTGWKTLSHEHRIYQQYQLNHRWGKMNWTHRLRNEQRWQQKIVNDERTGDYRFTNRIRFISGFILPVFQNKKLPALSLSNELLIHFGKEVIYNQFDQNRFFLGIKQPVSKRLSFDLGYMRIWQKKYTPGQYDLDHCLRLFFYYSSSLAKRAAQ